MRRTLIALAAAAAVALTGGRAAAGYEYRFATAGGTEQTNFTLNYGASPTLDVRVYLVATGADATTLAANGLKSYGVQINYDAGSTARVLAATDITNNAAFTGLDGRTVGSTFARSKDSIGTGAVASTTNGAEERLLLATFKFTGLANGDTLVFSVDPTTAGDTRLGDGTAIDNLINGQSGVITVTNVPEPGTLVLAGLLAAGVGGAGRRRLRPVAV